MGRRWIVGARRRPRHRHSLTPADQERNQPSQSCVRRSGRRRYELPAGPADRRGGLTTWFPALSISAERPGPNYVTYCSTARPADARSGESCLSCRSAGVLIEIAQFRLTQQGRRGGNRECRRLPTASTPDRKSSLPQADTAYGGDSRSSPDARRSAAPCADVELGRHLGLLIHPRGHQFNGSISS